MKRSEKSPARCAPDVGASTQQPAALQVDHRGAGALSSPCHHRDVTRADSRVWGPGPLSVGEPPGLGCPPLFLSTEGGQLSRRRANWGLATETSSARGEPDED